MMTEVNVLKPHKHHDVIIAWAAGHPIQCKSPEETKWVDIRSDIISWMQDVDYRVKPKEIEIEKVVFEVELPKSYQGVIPKMQRIG